MTGRSIHETMHYLQSQVCRLRHNRGSVRLDAISLYRGQHVVLFALWEQDCLTRSELAAQPGVWPATISSTLKHRKTAGCERPARIERLYDRRWPQRPQ